MREIMKLVASSKGLAEENTKAGLTRGSDLIGDRLESLEGIPQLSWTSKVYLQHSRQTERFAR